MSELPSHEERDEGRVRERTTPGWVKVLAIVVLALLAAFVVSRLFGIQHGPDLHSSWLAPEGLASVAAVAAA